MVEKTGAEWLKTLPCSARRKATMLAYKNKESKNSLKFILKESWNGIYTFLVCYIPLVNYQYGTPIRNYFEKHMAKYYDNTGKIQSGKDSDAVQCYF